MSYLIFHSAGRIPSNQLTFFRGILSLLILTPFVRDVLPKAFARGSRFLWIRSAAGAGSVLSFYFNLQHSDVGTATAFADLAPVFVVLLGWTFLKESLHGPELIGIALATLGAIFLNARWAVPPPPIVTLVGVGGAFIASISYLALREAVLEFKSTLVVWCLSLCASAACLLLPRSDWVIPSSPAEWTALFGVGLSALLGQVLLTRSFLYLRPQVCSVLGFTSMFWGLLLQIGLDGRNPARGAWLAYSLVVAGVVVLQITSRPAQDPRA